MHERMRNFHAENDTTPAASPGSDEFRFKPVTIRFNRQLACALNYVAAANSGRYLPIPVTPSSMASSNTRIMKASSGTPSYSLMIP